ncbi:MAG: methyltransferase domain-containing protein [Pseudomonadota bacterium]
MISDAHQYHRVIDTEGQDSLSILARHIRPATRILELGPARGYFSRYLNESLRCSVDAVEIDANMAEQARPWCNRLLIGDLEKLDLTKEFISQSYDSIVFGDVLEHLREPLTTLIQAVKLLSDDGQILVSVPNIAYAGLVADLLRGEFLYRDEGLLDKTHLRFFTQTSLEAMLLKAGLHVWQWEALERPLWDSEFRTRIENLPSAWADTLLARPNALCYQWIASARVVPPAKQPQLSVSNVNYDRFPVRLFLRKKREEFEFRQSKVVWGHIGQLNQTLQFHVRYDDCAQVRLSLADRPGYIHVQNISIHDSNETLCWQWHPKLNNSLINESYGMREASAETYSHIFMDGADTWLNLPIFSDIPNAVFRLSITLDWPMSGDYLALLPVIKGEIRLLQDQKDFLHQTINERDQYLTLRTAQISEREQLIAERDRLLAQRTEQLSERENMIVERDDLLILRNEQMAKLEAEIGSLEQELIYRSSWTWWLKLLPRLIKRTLKRNI